MKITGTTKIVSKKQIAIVEEYKENLVYSVLYTKRRYI